MAFDVTSGARLAAGILRRHHCFLAKKEAGGFWTAECHSVAELARLIGVAVHADEDSGPLAQRIEKKLREHPEICQRLEENFPNLPFAPLLERLGEGLADRFAAHHLKRKSKKPAREGAALLAAEAAVSQLLEPDAPPFDAEIVSVALFFYPRVAVRVALALNEGLPFPWTMFGELDAVAESRKRRDIICPDEDVSKMQLVGLAISGGGIRSATFGLGLLQSLAELKLTRYVDYLSTVSGGGYIGSWLHAWLGRERADIEEVRHALSPKDSPDPESIAAHPIKWLRQYSNYLAPRLGLLSPDTWSIFTVWARNWLLNLVVIFLALAALLMVPRGASAIFEAVHRGGRWWLGLLPLVFAVFVMQRNLRWFKEAEKRKEHGHANNATQGTSRSWFQRDWIHHLIAVPVLLSAMLLAAWLGESSTGRAGAENRELMIAGWFFVLLCYISFFGCYRDHFFDRRTRPPTGWWATIQFGLAAMLYNGISAGAGFVLLFLAGKLSTWMTGSGAVWHRVLWPQLVWGTTAVVLVYSAVSILHLGLFGRNLPDDRREWWSRVGAVQSIWMLGWVSVAGTAIYGPWLVAWLMSTVPWGRTVSAIAGSGWLATTVAGVLKGRSAQTGPVSSDPSSDLIARIAPPVFAAGLLLLVSVAVHMITLGLMGIGYPGMQHMMGYHFDYLSWWSPAEAWLFALVCGVAAYLLASRVDVNEFSMHNFYENRLVRCYLGASHADRQPNRFTGFDPKDDVLLSRLSALSDTPYSGPFAIVNTTLNLTSGEELAWQQRKAQSFGFTPLFSGFAASPTEERGDQLELPASVSYYGYRPTAEYAFPHGGIRLGKAMALSGAALSPNWGYHTSPATAFLLTVFNVRLGWWIGNPRHRKCWRRSGPQEGLGYLLMELAGAANNKRGYVYLSDGGHFENLGIYELVRRRCRYIIVSDGGEDASFAFDDLGNAIRKCRADLGVEIQIDLNSIRPAADAGGGRARSGAHCAIGSILYPAVPNNYEGYVPAKDGERGVTTGTMIYVKASLTGDEPADVLEYATRNAEFPHQSTADQFFDESQFESYRKLGYHVGQTVFQTAVERRPAAVAQAPLDSGFFSELRRQWRAASPKTAASFTRHADVLVRLMRRLREDPDLEFFDRQINPEWARLMRGARQNLSPDNFGLPPTIAERRAGFHFCNSVLQLMEDVYLDLNLEEESDHPDNAGWMNLFDHWSWSAMFRVTWMISASCYGARFRTFCENRLKLDPVKAGRIEIVPAGVGDNRLNYRERQLLEAGGFDWKHHQLHLLEIFVQRPDTNEDITELTVGFAVTKGSKLAYFRIQEHLRSMGLARRMVAAMVGHTPCLVEREPDWHVLPPSYPERVTEANRERIERMLDAAHIQRGPLFKKQSA